MENNSTKQEVSFRGIAIPEVNVQSKYQVADSQKVIDKISRMTPEQQKDVTLESVHYTDREISEVKLTTGDIIPVETAIALAQNSLLAGYTTGKTMNGGRTLKAKPSSRNNKSKSVALLPKF